MDNILVYRGSALPKNTTVSNFVFDKIWYVHIILNIDISGSISSGGSKKSQSWEVTWDHVENLSVFKTVRKIYKSGELEEIACPSEDPYRDGVWEV